MSTLAAHAQPAPLPAIEVRHVSLAFDKKQVLVDLSFAVAPGETLFLLGVTGTGKSVLLKIMLGLMKPDAGQVLINGQDIVPLSETELVPLRRQMGIVFQEGALFDSLNVYENVCYRLREEKVRDEAEVERRVREVLSFVEMEEAIDKAPSELSGGMQRRVSIARAIISQPSIMLYDSPTAGLDPLTAHTIDLLIAKLRDAQHATSVVVTQRLQDAFFLASFAYSVEQGGLVAATSAAQRAAIDDVRFLLLRDTRLYFEGNRDDLVRSQDPYLGKFLA
ncbi:MAG TPA: ATP-binding cassette domain-containing protein [Terriglobia bacterium]|nr:ATP-binding cassette domain-containing protein [Terriglobia bacterium]